MFVSWQIRTPISPIKNLQEENLKIMRILFKDNFWLNILRKRVRISNEVERRNGNTKTSFFGTAIIDFFTMT